LQTKAQFALQPNEVQVFKKLLASLLDKLQNENPDFVSPVFPDEEINIMWKLLEWPVEKVYPGTFHFLLSSLSFMVTSLYVFFWSLFLIVLDVLRALLLFQNAARTFFQVSNSNFDPQLKYFPIHYHTITILSISNSKMKF
jgi:hypothetical protein